LRVRVAYYFSAGQFTFAETGQVLGFRVRV